MVDTGFQLGSFAFVTGTDSGAPWVNESRVLLDDGLSATALNSSGFSVDSSDILLVSNFGLSVPDGSTVDGIEVLLDMTDQEGVTADIELNYIVVLGGKYNQTITSNSETYGGATDLWGASLSPSTVNNSSFGVRLSVDVAPFSYGIALDSLQLKVYYTAPPGWSGIVTGVVNPSTVNGVAVTNIASIVGII